MFVARCSFCTLILRGVPDHRLGSSAECPRCRNSFTLAPAADPAAVAAARGPEVVPADAPAAAPEAAAEEPVSPAQTAVLDAPRAESAPPRPRPRGGGTACPTAPRPVPGRRFTNFPGLASFLLGCFAFLAGGVLNAGLLALALGLLGLLLGILGLFFAWVIPSRRALPAAGLVVSVPALILPILLPGWLGLAPLGPRARPTDREGPAVMSLSGAGGLRRATGGETLWVDASKEALHHGDVRLRVSSAVVGPAEFEPVPGRQPPADRCLVVGLRVTNAGVARKISYNGWEGGDAGQGLPVLRDDQGKSYAPKAFGPGWVVKGRAGGATIPPGKSLDDVLVFEAPPRSLGYLRLELPAAPVGAPGPLRFEIPKHMIAFR